MKSVRSVERAIDIIIRFIETPVMDVSEIQKGSELPRPTLYRILNTIEQKGLLASSGDPRQYRLTYRALEMASSFLSTLDVAQVSEPFMQKLWSVTDETIALCVRIDDRHHILAKEIRSRQPLAFSRGVGHIGSFELGAAGKVILAFLPKSTAEKIINSVMDKKTRERLVDDLEKIRMHGYHLSKGEIIVGAASIAAPIFDREGNIIGSIAHLAPQARLTSDRRDRAIRLVKETAGKISAAMGCAPKLKSG